MAPWESYNGALGQTFQRRCKNDFTVRLTNPSLRQVLSNSQLPTKSKGDWTAVTQKGFQAGWCWREKEAWVQFLGAYRCNIKPWKQKVRIKGMPSLPCWFQNEAISAYSEASAGKTTTGPPGKWICIDMRHRRRCLRGFCTHPAATPGLITAGTVGTASGNKAATTEPPSRLEMFSQHSLTFSV